MIHSSCRNPYQLPDPPPDPTEKQINDFMNGEAYGHWVEIKSRGGMRCDADDIPHVVQAAFYEWYGRYVCLVLFNGHLVKLPRERFDYLIGWRENLTNAQTLPKLLPWLDTMYDDDPAELFEWAEPITHTL